MLSPSAVRPDRTGTDLHPIVDELRMLVEGGDYSTLLRRAAQLAEHVRRSPDQAVLAHDLCRLANAGPLAAIAAIDSLAEVDHRLADDHLIDLLTHPEQLVRRHAAWRLGDRPASDRAIPALVDLLIVGGIDTMHAHQTLRHWSPSLDGAVVRATVARLSVGGSPAERARLVDLLGVLGADSDHLLLDIGLDDREPPAVRAAAIAALGQRSRATIDSVLQHLAAFDDTVATDAALALSTRLARCRPAIATDEAACGLLSSC